MAAGQLPSGPCTLSSWLLHRNTLTMISKPAAHDSSMLVQVHSLWEPMEGRFKNYVRSPKANGYRSLHTVITASDGQPMEIQVQPFQQCGSMAAMLLQPCCLITLDTGAAARRLAACSDTGQGACL